MLAIYKSNILWNRRQLKSKPYKFDDDSRYARELAPFFPSRSNSAFNKQSTHYYLSIKNFGWKYSNKCVIDSLLNYLTFSYRHYAYKYLISFSKLINCNTISFWSSNLSKRKHSGSDKIRFYYSY